MLKKIMIFTLLLSCLASTNVLAKWWIFGQSEENVATRYLYLNDISFSELDQQVTLYQDMLPAGRVVLRGKAQAGKSSIGKVEVSLDNKETWQKADKSDDGGFEFSFIPETDRTYQLYVKILDTAGKSNEVDETYREITISNMDIDSIIRQALDAMIRAYQDEDPRAFMALVDENFAGDDVVLDRAIRKDFSAFNGLNLNYTLNNVASGTQGKVFVAISYNRQVTSTRSGETLTDRGLTEFVFNLNAGAAKVLSMKNPLIFGLSEAAEVATGTVNSGENDEVLILDGDGQARLGPVGGIGGDDGGSDGGSGGFPTPENLDVSWGFMQHSIDLTFDVSPDVVGTPGYEVVLEESISSLGSWVEVYRHVLDSNAITGFTSEAIAFFADPPYYYRVIIEKVSTSERSDPSNIYLITPY